VHHTLGLIHHQRNDLHSAERHFRIALECDADYPLARISLSKVLLQLHEPAKALPFLESELLRKPGAPEVLTLKGLAHVMAAQWTEAVRTFEDVLAAHPDDTRALLGAANAWMQLRKPDEAAPLLQRAEALAPDAADVYVHLGLLALLRSDRKRARIHFSRALEIEPENHDALHQLRLLETNDSHNA
jgi:Flp pilus assembly protein TadD